MRPVRWRDAWIAGLASALGFVLLQENVQWYLACFPSYKAIYGAFAVVRRSSCSGSICPGLWCCWVP